MRLQRDDGGWPWLFDADRGRTVEPYQIYSVHQDAMAPMGLFECYEASDDERYRMAAVRGVDWIYGKNVLGQPMLDHNRQLIYRSIARRPPWNRAMLYLNSAAAYANASFGADWRHGLELRRSDRPYHLGWILEAWCGREQLVALRPTVRQWLPSARNYRKKLTVNSAM